MRPILLSLVWLAASSFRSGWLASWRFPMFLIKTMAMVDIFRCPHGRIWKRRSSWCNWRRIQKPIINWSSRVMCSGFSTLRPANGSSWSCIQRFHLGQSCGCCHGGFCSLLGFFERFFGGGCFTNFVCLIKNHICRIFFSVVKVKGCGTIFSSSRSQGQRRSLSCIRTKTGSSWSHNSCSLRLKLFLFLPDVCNNFSDLGDAHPARLWRFVFGNMSALYNFEGCFVRFRGGRSCGDSGRAARSGQMKPEKPLFDTS